MSLTDFVAVLEIASPILLVIAAGVLINAITGGL